MPCISREVVRDAAQASGVAEGSLQATLEEPPRFWEKTPGRIPAHLNLVRTALLKRAHDGDFVYHGYAGHLLLSGISHVLRVRVIAGETYRVQTAMRDFDMNEKEAAQYVKTLNTQLRKWTKFLYGVDWQDPSLYDVVFRVDRVGVEGVADTIVRMTELPRFRPTEESRKAFDGPAAEQRGLVGADRRRADAQPRTCASPPTAATSSSPGPPTTPRRWTPSARWPGPCPAWRASTTRSGSAGTGSGEPLRADCPPGRAFRIVRRRHIFFQVLYVLQKRPTGG